MALQFSISFKNSEVDNLMRKYDVETIDELQSRVREDMKDAVLPDGDSA